MSGLRAGAHGALHAVMFDMDGLLVDTEPLWFAVEAEIMARLGGTWSHTDQAQLVGGSLATSVGYMLARAAPHPPSGACPRQWPPSAQTIAEWMVGGIVERIERGVTLLPGAAGLLAEVSAAGVPHALVTSSERLVMDAVLAQLRLAEAAFDVTVCAADVRRTKPDPEPYLLAAKLLGADPAHCVVLEDAPNGVAAAEAAGCLVVMVPNVAAAPAAPPGAAERPVHGPEAATRPCLPPGDGSPPQPPGTARARRHRGGCGPRHPGTRRHRAAVSAPGSGRVVVSSLRDISLDWLRAQLATRSP